MNNIPETVQDEQIACQICLAEVPVSEAVCEEASDYVVHFCGLDCYDLWRNQAIKQDVSSA